MKLLIKFKTSLFLVTFLIFFVVIEGVLMSGKAQVFFSEMHLEKVEPLEVFPEELIKNLPPDIDSQVVYFLNYFSTEKKESVQRWLKRGERFLPYFKMIYKEFGLPEDLVYLALIESGCNPFAVSKAGAVGIWQFVESTARFFNLKIDYWIDERKDFIKSTYASAKYFKKLYELFGDWRIAVASYNAGEGRLSRALKAKNYIDYWKVMNFGILPYETVAYLPQWLAITLIAKNPTKYGFQPLKEVPLDFEEVKVPGGVDLKVFALAGGIDYEELLLLNAELRRNVTPPNTFYTLKVPYGTKSLIQKNLSKIKTVTLEKHTPLGTYRIITLDTENEESIFFSSKESLSNSKGNSKTVRNAPKKVYQNKRKKFTSFEKKKKRK